MQYNITQPMPKAISEYQSMLNFRVPTSLKDDLLTIDTEYTKPAREALIQYTPVKKLMQNPLAVPRVIGKDSHEIIFSVSKDGKFQMSIDGRGAEVDYDDLKVILANVFLFTLNTPTL